MPILQKDHIASPFIISIKQGFRWQDQDLIRALTDMPHRFFEYQMNEEIEHRHRGLFLANDQNWLHVMDSYYYDLWHQPFIYSRLTALSQHFDIFCWSTGGRYRFFL